MSHAPRYRTSVGGFESVIEAVVGDFPPEMDADLAGPAVVEAAPEPRVDDLLAELVCRVEVVHGIEVSGRSGGVEAADVEIDLVGAQELSEDFERRGPTKPVLELPAAKDGSGEVIAP